MNSENTYNNTCLSKLRNLYTSTLVYVHFKFQLFTFDAKQRVNDLALLFVVVHNYVTFFMMVSHTVFIILCYVQNMLYLH